MRISNKRKVNCSKKNKDYEADKISLKQTTI